MGLLPVCNRVLTLVLFVSGSHSYFWWSSKPVFDPACSHELSPVLHVCRRKPSSILLVIVSHLWTCLLYRHNSSLVLHRVSSNPIFGPICNYELFLVLLVIVSHIWLCLSTHGWHCRLSWCYYSLSLSDTRTSATCTWSVIIARNCVCGLRGTLEPGLVLTVALGAHLSVYACRVLLLHAAQA